MSVFRPCGHKSETVAVCLSCAAEDSLIRSELRAENERLMKALRWYADRANWTPEGVAGYASCEEMHDEGECDCDAWEPDMGDRALAALKGGTT